MDIFRDWASGAPLRVQASYHMPVFNQAWAFPSVVHTADLNCKTAGRENHCPTFSQVHKTLGLPGGKDAQ